MIVFVDERHAPTLREPRDLKSFMLLADRPSSDREGLALAIESIGGALTGDHAWIPAGWLRRQSGLEGDADWLRQLEGMLDYAAGKGWIDAERDLVRAHIRWSERAAGGG